MCVYIAGRIPNERVSPHPLRPPAHHISIVMFVGPLLFTRHCAKFLEAFFKIYT